MNCTRLFLDRARDAPRAVALCDERARCVTFAELVKLAGRAQALLRRHRLERGDVVLLAARPAPALYAVLVGAAAAGLCVVLVEPWMSAANVRGALRQVQPKLFLGSVAGLAWGVRLAAVRAIPRWEHLSALERTPQTGLATEDVEAAHPSTITFTTGSTGTAKGVVRTHGALATQVAVLGRALGDAGESGPDLAVLLSFPLANLAAGRPTVVAASPWAADAFFSLDDLPTSLQPVSVTCGPALLARLMQRARLPRLRRFAVGGASTDVAVARKALRTWPKADSRHLYGGTEAEPVAEADLRRAVDRSEERGYLQTLYLGQPVPEIRAKAEPTGLWIAGPHVCPIGLGDAGRNPDLNRREPDGTVWHNTDDRITVEPDGWWYAGRTGQPAEDFALEQRIYAFLGQTASFVHRAQGGRRVLLGEEVRPLSRELRRRFPELDGVFEAAIVRDRRHRAKIDRAASARAFSCCERWSSLRARLGR